MPIHESYSAAEIRPIAGVFFTVADIRAAHDGHFFDRDTMRFFGSRIVGDRTIAGRFFITSEQDRAPYGRVWGGARRYSIREAMPDGSVETVGEFGEFSTADAARRAAKRIASEPTRYYVDAVTPGRALPRRFLVTARDPWDALDSIPGKLRVRFMGRAREDDRHGREITTPAVGKWAAKRIATA